MFHLWTCLSLWHSVRHVRALYDNVHKIPYKNIFNLLVVFQCCCISQKQHPYYRGKVCHVDGVKKGVKYKKSAITRLMLLWKTLVDGEGLEGATSDIRSFQIAESSSKRRRFVPLMMYWPHHGQRFAFLALCLVSHCHDNCVFSVLESLNLALCNDDITSPHQRRVLSIVDN